MPLRAVSAVRDPDVVTQEPRVDWSDLRPWPSSQPHYQDDDPNPRENIPSNFV